MNKNVQFETRENKLIIAIINEKIRGHFYDCKVDFFWNFGKG
jgi:hypothetical protein